MTIASLWNSPASSSLSLSSQEPPPANFLSLDPAGLSVESFAAWPGESQRAYIEKHGTGTPVAVVIGSGSERVAASMAAGIGGTAGMMLLEAGEEEIPYYYLPGSADASPTIIKASVEALFPSLSERISSPAPGAAPIQYPEYFHNSGSVDPDTFIEAFHSWHSSFQLEYVKLYGQMTAAGQSIDIVGAETRLSAFVSTDERRLYIVQSIDKNAIAVMSKADQVKLANAAAFGDISARLGLSSASATNFSYGGTSGLTADGYLNAMIADINSKSMPENDRKAFTRQLDVLKEQLGNAGLITKADIEKKATELKERFDRAQAFFAVRPAGQSTQNMGDPNMNVPVYKDVITINGDLSGITRGYQIFVAQERRLAEIAEERMRIVKDGRKLDVPTLVYRFQELYNLSLEAQVVIETEEINQQNDLLKTYAAMQDIVNRTLSSFEKADERGKYIFNLGDVDDYHHISANDLKMLAMFSSSVPGDHVQRHPLEILNNISRPTHEFFYWRPGEKQHLDLNRETHPQWSTMGTRLSETVTLINQNSQIMMNDVNSLDKQRNRHFELANNALAKMNEMIQNIGRM